MKAWLVGLWLVSCSWSAHGQPLTAAPLTGTWLGAYSELGPGVYCTLPAYLDLQPNGVYRLGLVDESAPARLATWAISGDTLRLDTTHYAPGLISLQTDTLRIGTVFPMVFRRFREQPADSAVIHRTLTGFAWQTDSMTVHFHETGQACLENRTTGQQTVHHWRLTRFGQSVFVGMQGSQYTTDGRYKRLWQVFGTTDRQFQVTGWNGQRVATETFRQVRALPPGDACRPTSFQPCNNCFSQQSFYNFSTLSFPVLYAVRNVVRQAYQPVERAGESGLIQIRFVLNCAGELGMFSLTGMDTDYCPRLFDKRITDQLITLCYGTLRESLIAGSANQADPYDRNITLQFRLKDGYLTDIFP